MAARHLALALALLINAATVGGAPTLAAPPPDTGARQALEAELARIERLSGGTLGVSARSLKTGERLQHRAAERFPMASTFKVAVAVKVLYEVDAGRLALDEAIRIDEGNLSPGSGELVKESREGKERSASVGDLLGWMLRDSDNTATDLLLARVGGPHAVTGHLRKAGIEGIDVDRPVAQVSADAWGFSLPAPGRRTSAALAEARSEVKGARRAAAARRFLADPRDTATPDAMATLLEQLQRGGLLGARSTALLLDHMKACRTGTRRIKGQLPRGTQVAHKTGTLMLVATNDVGMIELPREGGSLVVAIFLRGSGQVIARQERSVADAALAVYRYYSQ